jgi:hypothetical protein
MYRGSRVSTTSSLEYRFTKNDFQLVFEFIISYHLNLTKGLRGRTNQGKRGIGGELDEWLPGKLVEIATCRIMEGFGNGKELCPDFDIYSTKVVTEKSDPDITVVKESKNHKGRAPNNFIEIKRIEENSDWLGPRSHQLKSIKENQDALSNGYMIHTSIEFRDDKGLKERDITASLLKVVLDTNNNILEKFSSMDDLVARVEYVYSMQDLCDKGHLFEKGSIIPDTNFPNSQLVINKDGSLRKGFELKQEFQSGEHELEMKIGDSGECVAYSTWKLKGKFLLVVKNGKEFLHCCSPVELFNPLFGHFAFEPLLTYRFHFKNKLGEGIGKNIDDVWFSKRRLDELLNDNEMPSVDHSLRNIMSTI